MKIKLVGGSSQQRSLPFNSERTINFIPVADNDGKEVSALYGTPGLSLFSTAGGDAIRQMFTAANGRVFAVARESLYEIYSDGTNALRGALTPSLGSVTMDENGFQLAICDGTLVYILVYATNVFAQVTDVDLPSSGSITFIDGYFVVNKNSNGSFYISGIYDGLTWTALGFATAESSPDNLLRVINAIGQMWLFGNKTTEIWTNNGASAFPFARISGAKLEVGILSPYSAVTVANSVFWVGRNNIGAGIVYSADGFSPNRISTNAIEHVIQEATSPETIEAYTYQEEGHEFYVLTGGGLQTTLVYDISTGLWHERAYLDALGNFSQHLGRCFTYGFHKRLVGSRLDGKIFDMSLNYYSDHGFPLASERIYTHISKENKRIRYNQLEIAMEVGVGLQTGQGNDPQIVLWISKDGGQTYSGGYTASFGRVGTYLSRAVFRRLGIVKDLTFKIRITDPVKRMLIGSYLR